MKIWPTSVLKRAIQLMTTHVVIIAAVTLLYAIASFISNLADIIPSQQLIAYTILILISLFSGLYIIPGLSRLLIQYLLTSSSGTSASKELLLREMLPKKVISFAVLQLIIEVPLLIISRWSHGLIATVNWTFVPVIAGLFYIYTLIFLSTIVMVDRNNTIINSLKEGIQISRKYPINCLFVSILSIIFLGIYSSYGMQAHQTHIIDLQDAAHTQMFMQLLKKEVLKHCVGAVTNVLSIIVATALYIEVKQPKHKTQIQ